MEQFLKIILRENYWIFDKDFLGTNDEIVEVHLKNFLAF